LKITVQIVIDAQDGTPPAITTAGRIRLVDPASANLVRSDDGLFRTRDGKSPPSDANVLLAPATLETSNVNMAEQMVKMIELSRSYELSTRLITTAGDNEKSASQVLALN